MDKLAGLTIPENGRAMYQADLQVEQDSKALELIDRDLDLQSPGVVAGGTIALGTNASTIKIADDTVAYDPQGRRIAAPITDNIAAPGADGTYTVILRHAFTETQSQPDPAGFMNVYRSNSFALLSLNPAAVQPDDIQLRSISVATGVVTIGADLRSMRNTTIPGNGHVKGDLTVDGTIKSASGFETGDIKMSTRKTLSQGWVWASGATIGEVGSGATERANADTFGLFQYYFDNFTDAELPIYTSNGTGSTRIAETDASTAFANLCRMTIADYRGRTPVGRDNMGIAAANRITVAGCGVDGTVLLARGGSETVSLTVQQMPLHSHAGSTSIAGSHSHTVGSHNHGGGNHNHDFFAGVNPSPYPGGSYPIQLSNSSVVTGTVAIQNSGAIVIAQTPGTTASGDHSHTVSIGNTGNGSAHLNAQPFCICNVMIKL